MQQMDAGGEPQHPQEMSDEDVMPHTYPAPEPKTGELNDKYKPLGIQAVSAAAVASHHEEAPPVNDPPAILRERKDEE